MRRLLLSAAAVMLPCMIAGRSPAQVTGVWQVADGEWNVGDNWLVDGQFMEVPDAQFGDSAQINNAGVSHVVGVVPDVSAVNVSNGTLMVPNGGSLAIVGDVGFGIAGNLSIGGASTVSIDPGGSLSTSDNVVNNGRVVLTGDGASLDVGGNWSGGGVLSTHITAGGNAAVSVAGAATLSGTLAPTFDGVTPGFGDEWSVLTAGSISGNFASIDTSGAPALASGLVYLPVVDGGAAKVVVDNTLVLTVDRSNGNVSVSNPIGASIEVLGYTVASAKGLLSDSGFAGLTQQGAPGWAEANLSPVHLAELNLEDSGTLDVGESASLGAAYGPTSRGTDDLTFTYLTGAGDIRQGIVEYTGPAADIVLNVDPATGAAAISNLSPFIGDFDINGYSILSEAGSLNAGGWSSLESSGAAGAGWLTANPNANHLAELNLESSNTWSNGTLVDLGSLFTPGAAQDLVFQVATADGQLFDATVTYGELPVVGDCIAGDVDCNGVVDLVDFNTLKGNFGLSGVGRTGGDLDENGVVDLVDFNELKANFGNSAAVPEPSSLVLIALGFGGVFASRKLRRRAA